MKKLILILSIFTSLSLHAEHNYYALLEEYLAYYKVEMEVHHEAENENRGYRGPYHSAHFTLSNIFGGIENNFDKKLVGSHFLSVGEEFIRKNISKVILKPIDKNNPFHPIKNIIQIKPDQRARGSFQIELQLQRGTDHIRNGKVADFAKDFFNREVPKVKFYKCAYAMAH